MVFLNSEKKGIVQLFDLNRDNRITYKEFLRVVADNTGSCRGTGALHSRGRSAAASLSPTSAGSSMPRSTSQYQQYLASMNEKSSKAGGSTARSKKSQSSCPKSSTASRPAKSSQVAAPQATKELDTAAMDPDHRLAFKLEFTHVTEDTITQKVKMAKRHCVQVRKELVILPANRRPRRACRV